MLRAPRVVRAVRLEVRGRSWTGDRLSRTLARVEPGSGGYELIADGRVLRPAQGIFYEYSPGS